MTTLKIQIDLVLWDRLHDKGEKVTRWDNLSDACRYVEQIKVEKVTRWDNLSDACRYVEQIESGLKMRVYNGILHWEEGHHTLATATSRIIDF